MTILADDFYHSSNGDRWQLLRNAASGREVVRHEPNLTSGGKVTETDVQEFLDRTGDGVLVFRISAEGPHVEHQVEDEDPEVAKRCATG